MMLAVFHTVDFPLKKLTTRDDEFFVFPRDTVPTAIKTLTDRENTLHRVSKAIPLKAGLVAKIHGGQMRIGVDLGGTKMEFAAISGDGRILSRNRVPTPIGDYRATIEAIRDGVLAIEQEMGLSGTVGVGIPGSISPATGRVKNANSTWLIGAPLGSDLQLALERPVRLANDANCFTLSEAIDGAGKGIDVVFGVILGTGVGGGIVVSGRAMTGRNAISGEWGHNPLP